MATQIINNFDPRKATHIDERLSSVNAVTDLSDPTDPTNFLYEGAMVFVITENADYRVENVFGILTWVIQENASLVMGTLNILSSTTVLDMSLVTPAIGSCYAVEIIIISAGNSANIQSITNFPIDDKQITFYVENGKQVTFNHVDYDAATTDQIVLEDGFPMTLTGRTVGDESLTLKKHGVCVCQWDATQFMKASEWAQNLLSIAIYDDLDSTSTTEALSANQGRVLNEKINAKQDQLIEGTKIDIVPGTNNATISVIPKDWIEEIIMASPSPTAVTPSFIAGQLSGISDDYRYTDLRGLVIAGGGDRGLWILPPAHNAAVASNWIMLDSPAQNTAMAQYNYTYDITPGSSLISNMYYPRINTSSFIGDNLNVSFNTDGPATEKVSCAFAYTGLYKITIDITLFISGTSTARSFVGRINVTDGVQLAASPITTGNYRKYIPGASPEAAFDNKYVHFRTSYVLDVTDTLVDSAFTFNIDEVGANNWANVSLISQSTLEITKIR